MTDAPEFFIDRSLGGKHLAEALRGLGLTAQTMASLYGDGSRSGIGGRKEVRGAMG